jgi:hypothetical protein
LLCRETLISLGQAVYNAALHPTLDGVAASDTDAKRMLEAYIAVTFSGSAHEHLRKHARAASTTSRRIYNIEGRHRFERRPLVPRQLRRLSTSLPLWLAGVIVHNDCDARNSGFIVFRRCTRPTAARILSAHARVSRLASF